MAKDRIRFNWNTFNEVRTSPATFRRVGQAAERIATIAGEGFEAKPVEVSGSSRQRARTVVLTTDFEAMRREHYHGTLTRAAQQQGFKQ